MPAKARKAAAPSGPPARRELANFEAAFRKRFGETSIASRRQYQIVSTGSIDLDFKMGCGGYVVGRITEIWGVESSGKTTLAMIAAANFQRAFKTKAIAWLNMERTFDYDWATAQGVDTKGVVLFNPDNSEDVADMAKTVIRSGLFSLVVLDSVGGMVTTEEMDADAEKASVGTAAKVITRMVKAAAVLCDQTDTTMIVINQTRANLGFGGDTTTGGGFALKHVTTHKIKMRRTRTEPFTLGSGDNKVTVGFEYAATVEKNKVAPPRGVATFAMFVKPSKTYGPIGIDRVTEAISVGLRTGVIEQAHGGRYTLPNLEKYVGRDSVKSYLRDHPEVVAMVREQALARVAETVADEAPVEVAAEEGEVLDFATGAPEGFEPDVEILDKLRAEHPKA